MLLPPPATRPTPTPNIITKLYDVNKTKEPRGRALACNSQTQSGVAQPPLKN